MPTPDSRRPPTPRSRNPKPKRRPRPSRPARLALGRPRLRLKIVGIGMAVVLTLFGGRLVQLQGVDGPTYAARAAAAENRYVEVELAPVRGPITDRDGNVLADTVDAYDITADPSMFGKEITEVSDAPERAAELLAPLLGVSESKLAEKLDGKGRFTTLAAQQSPSVRKEVRRLKQQVAEDALENGGKGNILAGVFDQPHSKRVYPNGELAASLLGFVNRADKGATGLEAAYDTTLRGTAGKRTYVQVGGSRVPTAGGHEQPAVPGRGVRLTLDRDLQWAAQKAIAGKVEETGSQSGTVIAMDIKTGKILAMATAPGYDPNDTSGITSEQLFNPAMQEAFEPGSTSKAISMAAVLEEGAAAPGTHVTVPGTLQRADRVFHDDVAHGTWHLTLTGVLAKSSNIGTILATEQLGDTRKEINGTLYEYLRKFGIGRPTGLEYPGGTDGILANPEDWDAAQQFTIPFGQGVAMNAVQATSVFATIANGGVRIEPSLVEGTTGPDGRLTPADPPETERAVSEETAGTLSEMLEAVVSSDGGTGTYARIDGYRVAGKTGTANRPDPKDGGYDGYTASFIGFAPADEPRIAVSCILQKPHKTGHFGGPLCGPVFKEVTEFALANMKAAPSGDPAPKADIDW